MSASLVMCFLNRVNAVVYKRRENILGMYLYYNLFLCFICGFWFQVGC
jgi:hypothetical protein